MIVPALVALVCLPPILINETDEDWNDFDKKTIQYLKRRCPEVYPRSPCLVKLIKTAPISYKAICGRPKEE